MAASIIHVDMDAFFASVEQRDHPQLRGLPVVVGGRHRGVVAAASYEARRFGIHSAMSMRRALTLCPDAQVVPPRRAAYEAASAQVFEIFGRYTPAIEPLSIDEAFLDVTGSAALFGDGPTIARAILDAIAAEVQLPASAGVAACKFIAKLAGDMAKPRGLGVVAPGDERAFLAPLPVERIYGVGKVAAAKLHAHGIRTMLDAVQAGPERLQRLLGVHGATVHRLAQGIDARPVVSDARRKSISQECTFDDDISDEAHLRRLLLGHALAVAARLGRAGLHAGGVHIKLKDSLFRIETRQAQLDPPAADPDALYEAGAALLAGVRLRGRAFRLCGLGVHDLRAGPPPRGLFVDPAQERRAKLEAVRAKVHGRFGSDALTRATLLQAEQKPTRGFAAEDGAAPGSGELA